MAPPVDLDHEPRGRDEEVHDERADGRLASDRDAERLTAESTPEQTLRERRVAPQTACGLDEVDGRVVVVRA